MFRGAISPTNGSGIARGDRLVAFTGVVGVVGGDGTDLFVSRDLVEQVGQDRCITDVASGDLYRPDLQGLLVDADVCLAPDAPLGIAVLAGVPLSFRSAGRSRRRLSKPPEALFPQTGRVISSS